MIKGCQRRIILVKDTGSKYFEGAYFVLRNEISGDIRENEMMNEAGNIIDSYRAVTNGLTEKTHRSVKPYITAIAILSSALIISLAALAVFILT